MATATTRKTSSVSFDTKQRTFLDRLFPYQLVVGGAFGLLAAFVLALEKIHLLTNPGATLSCDINPIISCGSVIITKQAEAFGFPNPHIGLVGFSVVIVVGMALLARASFKRWFWLGLQLGTIFGVLFVHWLAFQSIYRIGALCPYCLVVWVVTIPLFWYTTLYNVRHGYLPGKTSNLFQLLQRNHFIVLMLWYLSLVGLIFQHFWDYFGGLLS